jgi:hypothetical protein
MSGHELRRTNTSGYRGVSWHKAARKWGAYIRVGGVRRYLGMFDTAEEASRAYVRAAAALRPSFDPALERDKLLATVRDLYRQHGIKALSTRFLYKQPVNLGARLRKAGLMQDALLAELGLVAEHTAWRNSARTYRGATKPKWSWEAAVAKAKEIVERDGELPTVQQSRLTGLSSLTNAVFNAGKTWEELRSAVGLKPDSFFASRNGMRWRSRPEACLSNFLYARGIQHKKGERYPTEYAELSGRRHGSYDVHFLALDGHWIDVEIWGDLPDNLSGGRYARTRALKETWNLDNPNFLGLQYTDCLSDEKLTRILEPFTGVIAPFIFDKPMDREIETAHWSNTDELLETCRQLAVRMPDGIFPNEQWLRKRGKYANRPGPQYNTVAVRVNQWLGGTRKVRRLLGQDHASTIDWTPELAVKAWQDFQATYGLSPTQLAGKDRKDDFPPEVVRRAAAIRQAATRHAVLDKAREGKTARMIIWTEETVIAAWRAFEVTHGHSPSKFVGAKRSLKYSKDLGNEAARIYNAARRLGVLAEARALDIG